MKWQGILHQLDWEGREFLAALKTRRFYLTLATLTIGVTIAAIPINAILLRHNLFSGGLAGISLGIYYIFGWPTVGISYLLLNIPLFILGWREYALKYVVITIWGVTAFSVALELTRGIRIPAEDPLMAAIIAGGMLGSGVGFYLRFGGSAGGLDILGSFLRKKLAVPISTTLNAVNAINLTAALIIFDLETAFYTGVFMGVNAWTLQRVQTGFSQHRAVIVISRQSGVIAQQIRERMHRGVTLMQAKGGFSGRPMDVVYAVINQFELGRLKDIVYQLDPGAYVVVNDATEVIGARFHTWEQEGYRKLPPALGGGVPPSVTP